MTKLFCLRGGTLLLSYAIGGGNFGSSNTFANFKSDLDAGLCPMTTAAVQVLPTIVRLIPIKAKEEKEIKQQLKK